MSKTLSQYLQQSYRILIFSGAGISTESGISDYRSKGGLWDRFHPVTIQEFLSSEDKRKTYWRQKLELYNAFGNVFPNAGHLFAVKIKSLNKLRGVITQNIDGLHQMAGLDNDDVLELHGTNRETVCLQCGDQTGWEETLERLKTGDSAPLCRLCQGYLKPNTISFGQALDPVVLKTAMRWASDCDLLLAIGSTLVVEPAASIPKIAKNSGARLVIITMSRTPLDDWADLKIEAPIGETLRNALDELMPLHE